MATKKPSTLDRLAARATDVTDAGKPKKDANPTITLKGKNAELFDRLVGADAVLKVAGKDQAERKADVLELLARLFVKLCIEAGEKQENPRVATVASNANFQVKHHSGVAPVYGPTGEPIKIPDQLRAAGFEEEVVQEIMKAAIEVDTDTRVKSFTELASSDNASQREIGEKIAAYVAKFTAENQGLMLEKVTTETVKPCWKDFSVSLAVRLAGKDRDKGIKILGRLWSVLPVDYVLGQLVFGGDKAEIFGQLLADAV